MKNEQIYNILMVIRWPTGGIRTFLRYVFRNLQNENYQFHILAPDIHECRILLEDLTKLTIYERLVPENISEIEFYKEVNKVILKGKFDLIYSQGFTSGICSVLAAKLTRTTHLMTAHDIIVNTHFKGTLGYIKKKALSVIFPFIDIIHTVSNDAKANLLENIKTLKILKNRLINIPHGIDVERFRNAKKRELHKEFNIHEDVVLIGFFGRFMPQKGFRYLIDALEIIVKNKSKKIQLLTFGDGGYINQEKRKVKKRKLERYISFQPFTPNIASTIKGLDMIVMPSLWEACGILAMEVMVAGVPIICTDCIGLREITKNTPATIVKLKNSKALANAILDEMNRPTKKRSEGFIKQASIKYDVKKQSQEISSLLKKILRDHS